MSITSPREPELRGIEPEIEPTFVAPLLRTILPPEVEVEEWFGEPPGGELFEEEERVVARAVERRRLEYSTVRLLARAGLERLGYAPRPILAGSGGAPVWPAGVRGSMTHCAGYTAAAVASARHVSALGIDAEPDAPLPEGVLDMVATPAERDLLAGTARMRPGPSWDRLLFSAKEAVYKAWCPAMGTWLDPHESQIVFHPHRAEFTAVLSREGMAAGGLPIGRLHGRWARRDGVLLTAVALR
jgi:4'-phosphopantetheinyl transferase EntD